MNSNKVSNFLIGSLIGVGIAAVATLIMTPFSGGALRRKVKSKINFLSAELNGQLKPVRNLVKRAIAKRGKPAARTQARVDVNAHANSGHHSNHTTAKHNNHKATRNSKKPH